LINCRFPASAKSEQSIAALAVNANKLVTQAKENTKEKTPIFYEYFA